MKRITIPISDMQFRFLSQIDEYRQIGLSELIRIAIRDLLKEEELNREQEFYKYCINCGKKLHNFKKPFEVKKFKIIEFRFCCYCFKKLQFKPFNDFPEEIQQKIKKFYKF